MIVKQEIEFSGIESLLPESFSRIKSLSGIKSFLGSSLFRILAFIEFVTALIRELPCSLDTSETLLSKQKNFSFKNQESRIKNFEHNRIISRNYKAKGAIFTCPDYISVWVK